MELTKLTSITVSVASCWKVELGKPSLQDTLFTMEAAFPYQINVKGFLKRHLMVQLRMKLLYFISEFQHWLQEKRGPELYVNWPM